MPTKENIEFAFIQDTLNKWGYEVKNLLIQEINSKDLISKGTKDAHLKDSISFQVKEAGSSGGELLIFFPTYGRFIEISYFKKSANTKKSFGKSNTALWTSKPNRNLLRRKKDTRWYSKTVYGKLNHLVGELMWGLTEEISNQIKSELLSK